MIASAMLIGCTKEFYENSQEQTESIVGAISFIADTDNSFETKTSLDGTIINWTEKDKVMIFGEDNEGEEKVVGYIATASGVKTDLEYSQDIKGKTGPFTNTDIPQYALYPLDTKATVNQKGEITFSLPKIQNYVANSFGNGSNVSVGIVNNKDGIATIQFKNVCGYLRLKLSVVSGDAAIIGKIVLRTKGNEKICGTFMVDADDTTPVAIKTAEDDGDTSITLDCGAGVALSYSTPTTFHFVVPAGAFADGFIAEVYSVQGHLIKTLSSTNGKTIVRNNIKAIKDQKLNWIPAGYTEMEYITNSNRNNVIRTDYSCQAGGYRMELKIKTYDSFIGGGNDLIFGQAASGIKPYGKEDARYYFTTLDFNSNKFRLLYCSSEVSKSFSPQYNTKYVIDACCLRNNQYLKVDGNMIGSTFYDEEIKLNNEICLFGATNEVNAKLLPLKSQINMYYANLYDQDNQLIRQYVPAYDGNKYGLYDVVGGTGFKTSVTGYDFSGSSITFEEDETITFNSFGIVGGEVLGMVDGMISVCIPPGTDKSNLIANFTTDADRVCVEYVDQTSGVTTNDFSSVVTYTLLKGLRFNNVKVKVYDFDLPVLCIETPDHEDVTSKDIWMENATINLYSSGILSSLGKTQIKGRGNSTWGYEKKPYAIKLDKKTSILGMSKDKRWDLLANYLDRTDIRNAVSFQLARVSPALNWTPMGEYVELIMNGKHLGNYYLCEHIKISKDRVNISAIDEDNPVDLTGGYLMEFDVFEDEVNMFKTSLLKLNVKLKDPDWSTGFSINYIRDWVNMLETKMSSNIASTDYKNYLDIDSYIDWWFVHEMTQNWEPNHPKSSYMYKDKESAIDNKIHAGPCWDFDYGTYIPRSSYSWTIKDAIWYRYLFKDPAFKARVKQKWIAQKSEYETVANSYINELSANIESSVAIDKALWKCKDNINQDLNLSFEDAISRMKTALSGKISWMDNEINKF